MPNIIDTINENRNKASKIMKAFNLSKPLFSELKDSLRILQEYVHKDSTITYKFGDLEVTKK